MKKIILFFITLLFYSIAFAGDINEQISNACKSGNYRELSKFFNSTLDITTPESEGSFTKAKAENLFKDFFFKHPARDFAILHKGESKEGAQYVIGSLTTTTGNFRVNFYLKKSGEALLIKEIKISNAE